jgi:hypothetical protein
MSFSQPSGLPSNHALVVQLAEAVVLKRILQGRCARPGKGGFPLMMLNYHHFVSAEIIQKFRGLGGEDDLGVARDRTAQFGDQGNGRGMEAKLGLIDPDQLW